MIDQKDDLSQLRDRLQIRDWLNQPGNEYAPGFALFMNLLFSDRGFSDAVAKIVRALERRHRCAGCTVMTQNTASLAIIEALKGNSHSGMCLCPLHEDKTPSLHVSAGKDDDKALLYCHAHCSQGDLVAWCKAHGLWPSSTSSNDNWQQQQWAAWEHKKETEETNSIRLHNAYAIMRAAGYYGADRDAARQRLRPYFRGRGIDHVPPNAMWLDKSKACALADRHPELGLKRYPAMVQAIVNDQGSLTGGVLVTFLTPDGSKNLRSNETRKNIRLTIGLIGGGFVPVGTFPHRDRPLIAAEGVEKAMALAHLTGYAAIATMSAGNMAKLKVPPCSKLIIGCDNDQAGRDVPSNGKPSAPKMATSPASWHRPMSSRIGTTRSATPAGLILTAIIRRSWKQNRSQRTRRRR